MIAICQIYIDFLSNQEKFVEYSLTKTSCTVDESTIDAPSVHGVHTESSHWRSQRTHYWVEKPTLPMGVGASALLKELFRFLRQ